MSLQIYNTLTRTKETFEPIEAGKVKMYVCGPTVYDYIHIGNARPMIFFDVVRRYLTYLGYEVRYVVNFTDVDDKLIRKAEQLKLTVTEVADRFIAAYKEDEKNLGIRSDNIHPRVTEHIPQIIAFIAGLVEKGYAYESSGDVYFRTNKFEDYGQISHQNMDQLQLGIRVEIDERKEHPQDFVLWKKAKPGEIKWSSPWGDGRPGWHIECSAMAKEYLGETMDIHGGGQDLQFPHHECEAAQSGACNDKPLANYWMHNGYVNINNEKMSKSLGNGVNVKELLQMMKPQVLRFFMLSTQYHNPLNFSEETIQQSKNSLERMENCLNSIKHRMVSALDGPIESEIQLAATDCIKQFEEKMNDDFNTSDAITAVFELVAISNQYLNQNGLTKASLQFILNQFQAMNNVLGILEENKDELLDDEVDALMIERTEARKAKNWNRADEIRDVLIEKGIVLEDTPQGVRWRRQ